MRLEEFTEDMFKPPLFTDEFVRNRSEDERAGLITALRKIKSHGAMLYPKSWVAEIVWISGLAEWIKTWNAELGTIWAD